MEIQDRQRIILDRVEVAGACSYQELSDFLNVSTMTIRRDVEDLSNKGLVVKVLGGVQKATAPVYFYESAIRSRLAEHNTEKRLIARQAVQLIEPGQTIFLDGSTTCLELAKEIAAQVKGLTIVTPSVMVCMELGRQSDNMIVSIGGQFDPNSFCFVGPTAEDQASKFFVDMAFVSTKGFLPDEGTFESSIATFKIKQIIAEQAATLVLLVDHSKFGQRALSKVLDVSQLKYVVTDAIEDQLRVTLEAGGCHVVIAGGSNYDENKKDEKCHLNLSKN